MADYGQMFRQMGRDVSAAITEPVKMRMQMSILKEEQDKEKEKEGAQSRLAATLSPSEKDLYTAEGWGAVAAQRKAKASRGGGGSRYASKFAGAELNASMTFKRLGDALEKTLEVQRTGTPEEKTAAMENYTALYNASAGYVDAQNNEVEGLTQQIQKLQTNVKSTYAVMLADDMSRGLVNLHHDKINGIVQAAEGVLKNYEGVSSEVLTDLENSTNEYGLGIDLSGVPSGADIEKYVWAGIAKKALSEENAMTLLNTRDPKVLAGIANNKDIQMPARKLAAALLKQQVTLGAIAPAIKEKFDAMSDADLASVALRNQPAGSQSKRRWSMEAAKRLSERGRFKPTETGLFKDNTELKVAKKFKRDFAKMDAIRKELPSLEDKPLKLARRKRELAIIEGRLRKKGFIE
jgi:hypothetical protein